MHYEYFPSNFISTKSIMIYDIDFSNQTVTSISANSDFTYYLQSTQHMPALRSNNYFLGDDYIVVRNESALPTGNYTGAV